MGLPYLFKAIAILGLLLPLLSVADQQTYSGEGQAFVAGGNLDAARTLSNQNAVRAALRQAMEARVSGDADAQGKLRLKLPALLKKAKGLLTGKRLQAESEQRGMLKVWVEIQLDPEALHRLMVAEGVFAQATARTKADHLPGVMVVLTEEINGKLNPEAFSSQPAIEALRKAGFRVVDEGAARNSAAHDSAVQALLRGDAGAAKAVALNYGAALVVAGRAASMASGIRSGALQAYGASVSLRAYQADSGAILANASAEGSYPHINPIVGQRKALEDAATKAMEKLVRQLDKHLKTPGQTVAMSVSGISYYQLSLLKKILQRDFPEITGLRQRGFAGRVAQLDVDVDDPQMFTDRVVQRDFGTFRLDVLSYAPHKVDFELLLKNR